MNKTLTMKRVWTEQSAKEVEFAAQCRDPGGDAAAGHRFQAGRLEDMAQQAQAKMAARRGTRIATTFAKPDKPWGPKR